MTVNFTIIQGCSDGLWQFTPNSTKKSKMLARNTFNIKLNEMKKGFGVHKNCGYNLNTHCKKKKTKQISKANCPLAMTGRQLSYHGHTKARETETMCFLSFLYKIQFLKFIPHCTRLIHPLHVDIWHTLFGIVYWYIKRGK